MNDHHSDHPSLAAGDGTLVGSFEFDHLLDRLPPPTASWAGRGGASFVAASHADVKAAPDGLSSGRSVEAGITVGRTAAPPVVSAPTVSVPTIRGLSVSRFSHAGLNDDRLPISVNRKRFGRR